MPRTANNPILLLLRSLSLRKFLIGSLTLLLMVCSSAHGADLSAGNDLFTNGILPRIRIEIPEPAMQTLRNSGFNRDSLHQDRPEVLCTVREGSSVWTNVGVHLKGSLGSFRPVDGAPAFTLSFTRQSLKQRFHGLEKISLNNSVQDPTRLSEQICRELYTRAGVPVPRAGHATVELNGRPLGVYVLLEGWNRQFMERFFRDPTGPLYEGGFMMDIDRPIEVAYGRTNNNRLTLPRLLAAAREPNPARRHALLQSTLDLDRFTRMFAMDMLLWNGDGYGLHANNYRIYHDRVQSRFVFMPHGMDQMLTIPDGPMLASGDGLVAQAVLSLPENRARVLDRIREFRRSFFQLEPIRQRMQELTKPLGAALAREAGLTNVPAPPDHVQAVASWLASLGERINSIDQQLSAISNLLTMRAAQSILLTNWTHCVLAGAPVFPQAAQPPVPAILSITNSSAAWVTLLWLEEGHYQWKGKVRLLPGPVNPGSAGFRVRSERKRSMGLDWGWDSRRRADYRPGGETGNLAYKALPATAGTNWTELSCDIDLRQPLADLELICEVTGSAQAWFDKNSFQLTRLTDPGR
ncbi:MAG TPA: CotH kinase family protein [Candidatus Saccharimonadales bacterium]|nr:CotH kinase family protein [Candidatus Saccharimonadales bacterium]